MPRIRLLSDTVAPASSDASGVDAQGNLIFDVGHGDRVIVFLDARAFANGATVSAVNWTAPDGGITIVSSAFVTPTNTGFATVDIPTVENSGWRDGWRLVNSLTAATGAIRNTRVWLRARGGLV